MTPKLDRKEEILDAFIRLAEKKGIDNTTMKDIAEEVGISVGLIYVDYKNKEALIDAFEERTYSFFTQHGNGIITASMRAEAKLVELLVGIVESYSLQLRKNRGIYEFASLDFLKYVRKNLKEKHSRLKKLLKRWIEAIMKQGTAEGVFKIEDIPRTAELFVEAFDTYLVGPPVMDRKHEDVVRNAGDMTRLLLRAILAAEVKKES